MSKRKGTMYERELFNMFYNSNKFMPLRSAGSGSTPTPAPDLIIGNKSQTFAIECKALKKGIKYFKEGEIEQLLEFSERFGAIPMIAIRYNGKGWHLLHPKHLQITKNGFHSISLKLAQEKGKKFDEFIKSHL